jgi:pyrroline-5-carboxylate reductase
MNTAQNPSATPAKTLLSDMRLGFIGGGNMASAIMGGLLRQGMQPEQMVVIEPFEAQRAQLLVQYGVKAVAEAGPALQGCQVVVWAVKPQVFKEAAAPVAPFTGHALHLSVAAGIRTSSLAQWLGTERWVRAMPNTPALVGKGMTGLFARDAVTAAERQTIEQLLSSTGACLWVPRESDLDAVTALSGSGPAYVFYFLEAMRQAGIDMGLDADTATRLAIGTFVGATHLAQETTDPPEVLRERVTSKGGTTHAALTHMAEHGVGPAFIDAMRAAQHRAQTLGDEFGC